MISCFAIRHVIEYGLRMGCFNCLLLSTPLDLIQHPPTSLCIKRQDFKGPGHTTRLIKKHASRPDYLNLMGWTVKPHINVDG